MKKTVYKGKYIRVIQENINGHIWERAYAHPCVHVIPITEDKKILIIREFREEEGKERWNFVSGLLENDNVLEEANRELAEEAGFRAEILDEYYSVEPKSVLNRKRIFVIAKKLKQFKAEHKDHGHTLEIKAFTIDELFSMALEGEFGYSDIVIAVLKLHRDAKNGSIIL